MIDPMYLLIFFLLADVASLASLATYGDQGAIGTLARLIWLLASAGILISAICLFIALRIQSCR